MLREAAHQATSSARIAALATACCTQMSRFAFSATRKPPVEVALDRPEQHDLGKGHKGQDEHDDGEDRFGVELLPGDVEQIANAAIAAEQFGGQHHLPGDAET